MPPKSEAQRRLMHAAEASAEVRERTGISKAVASEFTQSDPGGKLPKKKPKRGSNFALKRERRK